MLSSQALADWLKAHGVTADAFVVDGLIPKGDNRLVVLTPTGGPGEQGERTRDVLSIQVRTVGKQNNHMSAESLAWEVDDALMGAVPPLSIGTTRVISVQRQGGPPAFINRDGARRANFSCNYLLMAARTTF